ncbi:unnamed protein product [Clonostachys byssicola]|uniref:Uncharacterized protein n=1 Tax=Clonostachys byssicola TaxID=160290 RepID=A0A9N9V0A2_9HYPO|nr:unnamed protein product [Clonostachys byssicola]
MGSIHHDPIQWGFRSGIEGNAANQPLFVVEGASDGDVLQWRRIIQSERHKHAEAETRAKDGEEEETAGGYERQEDGWNVLFSSMTREEFAKGRDGAAAAGRNKPTYRLWVLPLSQSRPESAPSQSPYGWLVLSCLSLVCCLIVCGGRAYDV